MSILVGNDTKLLVSGLTGREGSFHGLNNRRYGTDLVAARAARTWRACRSSTRCTTPWARRMPTRR
jgi:succinyl-CoA synthetase alpha subunit